MRAYRFLEEKMSDGVADVLRSTGFRVETLTAWSFASNASREQVKAAVQIAKELCGICGKPMPKGEEMFKYHGYSGPCPTAKSIVETHEEDCPCYGDIVEHSADCKNCTCESDR